MSVGPDILRIRGCGYLRGCGGRYKGVTGEAVQRVAQNGNNIEICGPISDQIEIVQKALENGKRVEANGNGEVVVFLNLE